MTAHILDSDRLTIPEAAAVCGVTANTIHRWRRVGHRGRRLRVVRFGGKSFVLKSDLESFVEVLSDPPITYQQRRTHQ